ncbi:MAG: hypothetical protein ABIZ52_06170 [Candidatus Limnocylindrales bacterium]
MQPVAVRILHPAPAPGAGPLGHALATARLENAERLAGLFRDGHTDVRIDADVRIDTGLPDGLPFGARLRGLIGELPRGAGLVVLGSGSIPLAMRADTKALIEAAASGLRRALTNNVYSGDVIAIGEAANLTDVPDLPTDNALPRWLRDSAGYEVANLARPRLAMDLDSPMDSMLVASALTGRLEAAVGVDAGHAIDRMELIRRVAADPHRQLLVAGRTSAAMLRWLEQGTASRTRALVEERGLRAIGLAEGQAPPRAVLGMLLDDRGPEALGDIVAELGGAALIDSRVLLAHRLGADESSWPSAEDRFASDLLLVEQVDDPWLRALAASARGATIPVLLGGHSLVGPGLRLLLGERRGARG